MAKYDWEKIEQEYITGKMSAETLAKKHNMPYYTMSHRVTERKLSEKREKYRESVLEKSIARARAREVRAKERIRTEGEKALKLIKSAMESEATLHLVLTQDKEGNLKQTMSEKVDTKALRDLVMSLTEILKVYPLEDADTATEEGGVIEMEKQETVVEQ